MRNERRFPRAGGKVGDAAPSYNPPHPSFPTVQIVHVSQELDPGPYSLP